LAKDLPRLKKIQPKMKKRTEIKPNIPSVSEIQALFYKRDKRTYGGRKPKWKPGEQVRLQTRVRPNTLIFLKGVSKDTNESIGEVIDKLVQRQIA